MKLPNFLIVGAAKCGTTSVYHYLRQHPQVYMSPIKETNFFAYEKGTERTDSAARFPIRSREEYVALFRDASREIAVGEASPRYLVHPQAAERIHSLIPEAKIIAILRNPIDRAYSAYSMRLRDGKEPRSFAEAVREEESGCLRENLEWGQNHYLEEGDYVNQLRPYLQRFDRKHIAIYLFEDLEKDPIGFMREVYQFLDVSDEFVPDTSVRYNVSGVPKQRALAPILIWKKGSFRNKLTGAARQVLPKWVEQPLLGLQRKWQSQQLVKPPMSPEIREKLALKFRDDILQLQDILDRDLSHWLK